MNENAEKITTNLQLAVDALRQTIDAVKAASEDLNGVIFYNSEGLADGLMDTVQQLEITAEQLISTKNIVIEDTKNG